MDSDKVLRYTYRMHITSGDNNVKYIMAMIAFEAEVERTLGHLP